ncbi:FAD-binding oxidoreductase, partial [Aduncisulcus paluster]
GTRSLEQSDVLVVAPYNAQVLTLRATLAAAGMGEVLVGTVDKFQGRQAPVVFVSMTASAVDDVPRGMSFLLNRNRLNVAISRAKFQAVIVRSPALTEYLPATPDGLVELGAFLALSPDTTNSTIVGERYVSTDADVLAGRTIDQTGRYRGIASVLVRPGSAEEVAAILKACKEHGHPVTTQGGRTSMVAGTVTEHDDVLLSTERLTDIGLIDTVDRRIRVGSGLTLAALQQAATKENLQFGVDIGSRDSATLGGMASTNAGGLRTVRYGNMREQVIGLQVVLPDGSIMDRHSDVRADNTGYDLTSLFVGAEGTLGVITALELRLHPVPTHNVAAITGFGSLDQLVEASRIFRDLSGIAALELMDSRLGIPSPVDSPWLLLIELARDSDPTEDLSEALEAAGVAEHAALIAATVPDAIPVLFGHVGEGNLHLNVLRCPDSTALYQPMMTLIAELGGNVSSEHGVGTLKRDYLGMARTPGDIAAMRAVKAAFDPTGYLNPAKFSRDWFAAWNAHDIEAVLEHFDEDAVFTSAYGAQIAPETGGVFSGKQAIRAYWAEALTRNPDLHFEPVGTAAS